MKAKIINKIYIIFKLSKNKSKKFLIKNQSYNY